MRPPATSRLCNGAAEVGAGASVAVSSPARSSAAHSRRLTITAAATTVARTTMAAAPTTEPPRTKSSPATTRKAAVVAAAGDTACVASDPTIRAAAPTWVTTGSVTRARDVNRDGYEKENPGIRPGFSIFVGGNSFAEFAGREVAAVHRLREEFVLPVCPELADSRVGFDHCVPQL